MTDIELFERSFASGSGGCRRTCNCGREFYDDFNPYDWEEGELEALRKDPKATCLDWSVSDLDFAGKSYVMDCDCWHNSAKQIMHFLDKHGDKIANYFANKKAQKQAEANAVPKIART